MLDHANQPAVSSDHWDETRLIAFAAQELDAEPDEFSTSENLISLGLGSVSLMRLKALLQQDGIDASFRELAEAGSIDGWVGLLDGLLDGWFVGWLDGWFVG